MRRAAGRPNGGMTRFGWVVGSGLLLVVSVALILYIVARPEDPTDDLDPAGTGAVGTRANPAHLEPKDIVEVIPPDGIPAIDDPSFVDASTVDWLTAHEPVIAVEVAGRTRAYPLQILTWHEIVNDTIAGRPIAVTFCPLCNTAIAFERPTIGGEVTTFGTSGKLINSNLLMYDRATKSLWPQVTGVALTGPMKGRELERIPAQIVAWTDFVSAHPDGVVLSRDTGYERRYGENPYPGYDDVEKAPFLYSGEVDGRLAAVERVLGMSRGSKSVAVPYFRLQESASRGVAAAHVNVADLAVVVFWKKGTVSALDQADISASRDVGAAAAFSRMLGGSTLHFMVRNGSIVDRETRSRWDIFGRATSGKLAGRQLRRLDATDSFWFDWAAFHPETEVWRP